MIRATVARRFAIAPRIAASRGQHAYIVFAVFVAGTMDVARAFDAFRSVPSGFVGGARNIHTLAAIFFARHALGFQSPFRSAGAYGRRIARRTCFRFAFTAFFTVDGTVRFEIVPAVARRNRSAVAARTRSGRSRVGIGTRIRIGGGTVGGRTCIALFPVRRRSVCCLGFPAFAGSRFSDIRTAVQNAFPVDQMVICGTRSASRRFAAVFNAFGTG